MASETDNVKTSSLFALIDRWAAMIALAFAVLLTIIQGMPICRDNPQAETHSSQVSCWLQILSGLIPNMVSVLLVFAIGYLFFRKYQNWKHQDSVLQTSNAIRDMVIAKDTLGKIAVATSDELGPKIEVITELSRDASKYGLLRVCTEDEVGEVGKNAMLATTKTFKVLGIGSQWLFSIMV